MNKILNYIIKFLFPEHCIICRKVIPLSLDNQTLCQTCKSNIPYISGNLCKICGKPIKADFCTCPNCESKPPAFDKAFAAFDYETVKNSIHHFKYKKFLNDGIILSDLMTNFLKLYHSDIINTVDIIIPIPIHKNKFEKRGFNQAAILAEHMAKNLEIKYYDDILLRIVDTKPQSSLSRAQRAQNIKNAFSLSNTELIENKNILLIDDIFTTGYTVNECARILKMYGANKVFVYCLSQTTKTNDYY